MKEKKRLCKSILAMLVVMILTISILAPGIAGKSLIKSENNEKRIFQGTQKGVNFINNLLGRIMSNRPRFLPTGIFNSNIHTICDGIEKTTSIFFGSVTEIDADDNPATGNENGADIDVKFLISPWLDISNDIGIGLTFSLTINRLGEDIKESDFSISLEIGDNILSFGFWSPSETGNEIPDQTSVSFSVFFYLFQRLKGINLDIEPIYNNGNENKKIELFSELNSETIQQRSSIGFNPAIKTDVSFKSTKQLGVWTYEYYRQSSQESEVTTTFETSEGGFTKETILTINRLPKELIFSLGITPLADGGGSFLYESSEMYDIELQINSNDLINSIYSLLRNTPRRMYAEWIPMLNNGEYHIEIDSDGTDFIIRDTETNPFVNFEITEIETVDFDAYWNFTNPGTFTVYKNKEINFGLDFSIGTWIAQLNVQPSANFIETTWLIDNTGYLTIDTNYEPLTTVGLLIKGPLVGLHTIGEGFKADDLDISWTLWPPQEFDLDISGMVDFISISIDIFLIDNWYHLWPWLFF